MGLQNNRGERVPQTPRSVSPLINLPLCRTLSKSVKPMLPYDCYLKTRFYSISPAFCMHPFLSQDPTRAHTPFGGLGRLRGLLLAWQVLRLTLTWMVVAIWGRRGVSEVLSPLGWGEGSGAGPQGEAPSHRPAPTRHRSQCGCCWCCGRACDGGAANEGCPGCLLRGPVLSVRRQPKKPRALASHVHMASPGWERRLSSERDLPGPRR